jgi:hypothetical protein
MKQGERPAMLGARSYEAIGSAYTGVRPQWNGHGR